MNVRYLLPSLTVLLAAGGCVAQAPQSPTAPAATVAATLAPGAQASSAPAPAAATPGAVTSAAAFSLRSGRLLKAYDFKGLGGVYHEPGLDRLYVVDALTRDSFSRFQLLTFDTDGTFRSARSLAPDTKPAPSAVDDMGFDQKGSPVFAYRDGERFTLTRFVAGVPERANNYPLHEFERAGPTAVRTVGRLLHVAALGLPAGTSARTGGVIAYGSGSGDAEDAPTALFQVADPFNPTMAMALGTQGEVYLAGSTKEGKLGIKRLGADQTMSDLPVPLTRLPDRMWVGPDGRLLLGWDGTGSPARVQKLEADGSSGAETEVRLADGGFLIQLRGLAFDGAGRTIISGAGFDASARAMTGLFTFSD